MIQPHLTGSVAVRQAPHGADLSESIAQFTVQFAISTALVGLAVGFLVGLTGVGGGVLLAPILVFLGIQPSVAVGTDMVYGTVTKIVATVRNVHARRVDWSWAMALALGSVPAGIAGSLTVYWLRHHHSNAEAIILQALGAVLAFAAVVSLLSELVLKRLNLRTTVDWTPVNWRNRLKVAAVSAAIGFVFGLTSVGSGSLFALMLLFCSRLDAKMLVGTDIAHATFLVAAAAVAHLNIGTVNLPLAANLLCGSIPGVMLGTALMPRVPSRPLKIMICVLVLAAGAKMIVK